MLLLLTSCRKRRVEIKVSESLLVCSKSLCSFVWNRCARFAFTFESMIKSFPPTPDNPPNPRCQFHAPPRTKTRNPLGGSSKVSEPPETVIPPEDVPPAARGSKNSAPSLTPLIFSPTGSVIRAGRPSQLNATMAAAPLEATRANASVVLVCAREICAEEASRSASCEVRSATSCDVALTIAGAKGSPR